MSGVRKIAASERFSQFSGRVRRWEKNSPPTRRWVKPEAATASAQFKWVATGADVRTEEERLAKRRKYTPLKVDPIPDLASFMPPAGTGWGGEKVAAVVVEPEQPRRSLRARTERTYVDGEDDDFEDERSMSEDEPAPPTTAAAAPAASAPPAPLPPALAPAAPAAQPPQPAGPAS